MGHLGLEVPRERPGEPDEPLAIARDERLLELAVKAERRAVLGVEGLGGLASVVHRGLEGAGRGRPSIMVFWYSFTGLTGRRQ